MADAQKTTGLNWIQTSDDRAETVVLLHAVGYDLTYWDRQIEVLGREYNVVALDLPGHGRSAGRAEDWTFAQAVRTVAGLMEEVSRERCIWWGFRSAA